MPARVSRASRPSPASRSLRTQHFLSILDLTPGERVRWRVVDGPPEWIGTTIDWRLSYRDGFTDVLFVHEGLREWVDFLSHCSTKWAVYLLSLKALVETGTGSPSPVDVKLTDWD